MISLRKHIEGYKDPVGDAALEAYRSALVTIGECGEWAVPEMGDDLSRTLAAMSESLNRPATPEDLTQANDRLKTELSNWAGRAHRRHRENEKEIREIISVVANTSATVAERGENYAREIGSLNKNLQSLVNLNDISVIRRSILESTRALQDCVEKMVEDGRQSAAKLSGEISEYRARLEESERISSSDRLTGLANRRAFETNLELRIAAGRPFCMIMMDLNDFKSVNDRYGHLAGDDLLQQFAEELKTYSPATDLLARWGGDEFVAIVPGAASEGEARLQRIRDWVLGEYKVRAAEGEIPIVVSASLGFVEWDGHEDGIEMLARADKRVYADKEALKGRAA
jgi:diguanylate cyclase